MSSPAGTPVHSCILVAMDDASLERACVEIVAAGAEVAGGLASAALRDRVAQAAMTVMPALQRHVRAISTRNAKLFREARIEPEDVAQEVLRRLIEGPPSNPDGRDPVAAVLGWARAVANNMLIDRRRRFRRETTAGAGTDHDGERCGPPEPIDPERPAEDVLAVLREIERMHAASAQLGSYKYLRETFGVLVKEPDIAAFELAQRVGLIEPPPAEPIPADYRQRARKAAQYAWKLRQRTLDLLAERLGRGRRNLTEKES